MPNEDRDSAEGEKGLIYNMFLDMTKICAPFVAADADGNA